eukprot:TRINITY_DN11857_c0_g1_i1.p1 TRINITY_DN11857_c0_g1~~TRINITY_DN11857_c0_g1_i1.p1  ORF type:complete len:202 (-),score=55.74 TRINITY_DN11857_c0_g1_i1:35-640(-)
MKKIDVQYAIKLQEFEKMDSKLEYIKDFILQNRPQEVEIIPDKPIIYSGTYKLRASVITANDDKAQALSLLNMFVYGKVDGLEEGKIADVKGYSLTLPTHMKQDVEFNIWYLGTKEEAAKLDISYYKNVEIALIVYNTEKTDEENLKLVSQCVDSLKSNIGEHCMIVISGLGTNISTESPVNGEDNSICLLYTSPSPRDRG